MYFKKKPHIRFQVTIRAIAHAPDDIVVLELLEERDLADGGARHALVLRLEPDLLERDDLVRVDVLGFVHDAVRACRRA